MPRKGMRSIFFSPNRFSSSPTSPHSSEPSPSRSRFANSRPSFSEAIMDRTLELAEPVVTKWNPETTSLASVTSLFYENRREARDFIKTVHNLQKAMHFHVTENSNSEKLIRAQNLMQIAMKRLQKEFYQILSLNRAHLDPESVSARSSRTSTGSSISSYDEDDEYDGEGEISEAEDVSIAAMADLKLIAECMIASGYGKECVHIYKIIRKSIVDEAIYKLGVEKFASSQVHKMHWEAVEVRIRKWLDALRTAVTVLFNGERILCDHVFASSDSIRESCFAEITREGAMILFGFPENVAKNSKKSPEKVFRALDMYTAIADRWPEIDSIFSFGSTVDVKSQALTSLAKIGEYVRAALIDFDTALQKDHSKTPISGAGIHHLTTDTMTYLCNLADYSTVLADILADSPPPAKNSLPETYFGLSDSDESPAPPISVKFAWLILVLLCKLDTKAKYYRDVSLSYLFLANNLQYVVVRVRTSNLKYLLGEEWLSKHESKVKQFASNYERLGWGHVIESLPSDPTTIRTQEEIKEAFWRFNSSFDQAHKKNSVCVVPDRKLRDEIKASIARNVFRLYRELYAKHGAPMGRGRSSASIVRYTPEDVAHRLSDLYFGVVESGGSSSFESSPATSQETISFELKLIIIIFFYIYTHPNNRGCLRRRMRNSWEIIWIRYTRSNYL